MIRPTLQRMSPWTARLAVALLLLLVVAVGTTGVQLVRDDIADGPGTDPPAQSEADAENPTTRAGPRPSDCAIMPIIPRPRSASPGVPTTATPYFGVLGSRISDPARLRAAGVTTVTLAVAWDRFEPRRGCLSRSYAADVLERYDTYRDAGLDVVLDAGMQYPPAWVFALPGDTRFVNQHGDLWRGDIGADVPDAVFNPAVRRAQGRYIAALGAVLRDSPVAAVRLGGLVNNELHYPVRGYAGHQDSYWAFSTQALAVSPVPDYRPGSGSPADARAFLDFYLGSINGYAAWQAQRYRYAFGRGPTLQVLLPSWGVRPGDRTGAESARLSGQTRGELTGALNEGLDWDSLARAAATWTGRVQMYSTWMDAADQGTDPRYVSPMRYIAGIARPLGLEIAGENTGSNTVAEMRRAVERVASLGLSGMFWMNADQLLSGRYATLDDYAALIRGS